jgi:ribosomal-protein-alanine N-acetyltransferase
MAVDPNHRRRGVASEMIKKLMSKLFYQRRNRIVLEIRESNLAAQLCFRNLGFRATGIVKNHYQDSPEDAYLFQYRVVADVQTSTNEAAQLPKNTGSID